MPKPDEKMPPPRLADRVRWYAAYWRKHRFFLAFLIFFTLVSSAVAIAYPLVFKEAIDRAVAAVADGTVGAPGFHAPGATGELEGGRSPPSKPKTGGHLDLGGTLLVLGLIALGRFVAGFYPFTRAWMNNNLDRDIREAHFAEVLKKDYRFQSAFRTGDVVTRLTDDLWEFPKVAWLGCSGVFRALDSGSKLVFCIGMMLLLDARLAALAVVPLPFMLAAFYFVRRRLADGYEAQQQAISRTNDLLEATFSGIRIVKAFGAEPGQESRLAKVLGSRIGIELSLAKLTVLMQSLDTIASRLGQVLVLAVGGFRVADGTLSLGTLYAIYVYLDMLTHPMMDLPMLLVSARQSFVSIDRLDQVKDFPAPDARAEDEAEDRARGGAGLAPVERLESVELRGARFAYDRVASLSDDGAAAPAAPPAAAQAKGDAPARTILEDVTFRVKRGERVAVVGPVGSGKSTLLKMLAGVLPAPAGTLLVNGRPIEGVSFPSYRRRLGYVPQESLLFSESIDDNVVFGREGVDAGAALDLAQMTEELPLLAGGRKTVLGAKGTLVSGGQRQRIAIARALAGAPDLVLLDDCTASLDARAEERFWEALRAARPDAACVVVTHRLATVARADRIVVVDRGRIADEGTHAELAVRSPVYRSFLDTESRRAHLETPVGAAAGAAAV